MKRNLIAIVFILSIISAFLTGCKKDKPETNQEELITTVRLTFTPTGPGVPVTYQWRDIDGEGGASPVIEDIELAPATVYNVSIQFLNESVSPADDITTEINNEAASHRIYYVHTNSNITVNGLNNDVNGVPLGTNSTWTTGGVSTGSMTITLRHYPGNPPNKAASDPVDSPKSSTDVMVVFPTRVN